MSVALRDYQIEVRRKIAEAVAGGSKRPLVVGPTGIGKTVIFAAEVRDAVRDRHDVLVLAHRREIIGQTSDKLHQAGVPHGVLLAGSRPSPLARAQVAGIQTLAARAVRSDRMDLPPARLIVVDEAHHALAKSYRTVVDKYPEAIVVGFTATPMRGDGRGLGNDFDCLIEGPQVHELIKLGYLVKPRYYAPVNPDLKGVTVRQGDYAIGELGARMNTDKLVGDVVENWLRFGERRPTVVFATTVGHSVHLRDEFIKTGIRAEHIDGGTPKPERDASLARLASGETEVLSNCAVLTEGWDCPPVSCAVLARPTRSMGLYRQMGGRILRPAPGKTDAILIDHSGAVFRHGFLEDPVVWSLDPDKPVTNPEHEKRKDSVGNSRVIECFQCHSVALAGEPCPHCGYMPKRPPRAVEVRDGHLGLVEGGKATAAIAGPAERAEWHGMLCWHAAEKGYAKGWVAHQFKAKFGYFPPWGVAPPPVEPSMECRRWLKSRQIAYAKARASA